MVQAILTAFCFPHVRLRVKIHHWARNFSEFVVRDYKIELAFNILDNYAGCIFNSVEINEIRLLIQINNLLSCLGGPKLWNMLRGILGWVHMHKFEFTPGKHKK